MESLDQLEGEWAWEVFFFAYSAYFIAHYMQNMQNNLQA
jgi:hypothetical protein